MNLITHTSGPAQRLATFLWFIIAGGWLPENAESFTKTPVFVVSQPLDFKNKLYIDGDCNMVLSYHSALYCVCLGFDRLFKQFRN